MTMRYETDKAYQQRIDYLRSEIRIVKSVAFGGDDQLLTDCAQRVADYQEEMNQLRREQRLRARFGAK